jgi:hypothetical protein
MRKTFHAYQPKWPHSTWQSAAAAVVHLETTLHLRLGGTLQYHSTWVPTAHVRHPVLTL